MKTKTKQLPALSRTDNILYKYCSEEWHPIIDNSQVVYSFKKNEIIFSEGDPVKGIYFIISGKVKIFSVFDKTKLRIHRLAGDGKILGHRGFSAATYPVSAIALTDTVVSFFPTEIFRNLIKTNSTLSLYLIDYFSGQLRESEERMKSLMHSDVKHRMAKILFILIESFGFEPGSDKLSYCLSRKDFAGMAGITYETTVRTLNHFHKKGLIKIEGKGIRILDLEGLKDYILPH